MTTNPPSWTSENGVSNLYLPGDVHVWIQPRRHYCDRGHWEWGCTGLNQDDGPSYYFMRLDRARHQIQSWLSRHHGDVPVPSHSLAVSLDFQHTEGQKRGWRWEACEEGWVAHAAEVQVFVSAPGDLGDVIVQARGIESLDHSDRFPRRYLDPGTAMAEVEDFLVWRLAQIPAEIPGPLVHSPLVLQSSATSRRFRP